MAQISSQKKILTGQVGRPLKDPEEMSDPESTGRKRAAHLYPIFKDEDCEWKGKKNCGGGLNPIVGCINGKQKDRHHGPIKDTRHNEPGNVHKICSRCHHVWHAMNDVPYNEELYKTLPHTPQTATPEELVEFELTRKVK